MAQKRVGPNLLRHRVSIITNNIRLVPCITLQYRTWTDCVRRCKRFVQTVSCGIALPIYYGIIIIIIICIIYRIQYVHVCTSTAKHERDITTLNYIQDKASSARRINTRGYVTINTSCTTGEVEHNYPTTDSRADHAGGAIGQLHPSSLPGR